MIYNIPGMLHILHVYMTVYVVLWEYMDYDIYIPGMLHILHVYMTVYVVLWEYMDYDI